MIEGGRKGRAVGGGALILLLLSAMGLAQPTHRIADATAIPPVHGEPGGPERPPAGARSQRSFPFHDAVVAIINDRGFACSGVLIHPRAVLTARHCQGGRVVMFGATTDEPRGSVRIVEFRGAPNVAIDMALMILKEPAPVTPYSLRRDSQPPGSMRVVGFGCPTPGSCDGAGHRSYFDARLPAAGWGCDPTVAASLSCLPSSEMVLPRSVGADTCAGDSGGAVLEGTPHGWSLVAITSRGVRDAVLPCGDGGVYVRVEPQLAWIEQELKDLQQPTKLEKVK